MKIQDIIGKRLIGEFMVAVLQETPVMNVDGPDTGETVMIYKGSGKEECDVEIFSMDYMENYNAILINNKYMVSKAALRELSKHS